MPKLEHDEPTDYGIEAEVSKLHGGRLMGKAWTQLCWIAVPSECAEPPPCRL